jgi:uncharacterized protein YndB with AHSA1/START domain
MSFEFTVSDVIPATPDAIYAAWLDSVGHTGMTGAKRAEASAVVGDRFTAHDGYISGTNLVLEPSRRIVQSWRTTRFTDADPDSRIEVTLEPVAGGTRVTVAHSSVPDGHTGYQDGGWQHNYFDPMKTYFRSQT